MPISPAELLSRLDRFPRLPLAEYPTPLEPLNALSREIGRPVYVKRDDEIGPGLGGSKTRKLEYLLADAQQRGYRKVVTFGGPQSNHARITAAAALRCGMQPHLFYFVRRPAALKGNLLLNQLMGAHLHFIPFGGEGDGRMTIEKTIRLVRLVALARLGRHYFIPVGGHSWLGCLGYVRAAVEIDQQARDLGLNSGWLVTAAGTGGTLAGIMAGLSLIGSQLRPLGIDVGKLWKDFPVSIAHLASELCTRLGEPRVFHPAEISLVEGRYVGQGYAIPTEACQITVQKVCRCEGLILDPVYTGKAFAGMIDLCGCGELGQQEPVIFLHTGGAPALFAQSQ